MEERTKHKTTDRKYREEELEKSIEKIVSVFENVRTISDSIPIYSK